MEIEGIIRSSKTIAVVGLSDKPHRASYNVANYLMKHGFRIIPVNPNLREWNGIKAYSSLSEIKEKVDIVDIFRRSEFIPDIVEEAIKIGAKAIWMQIGIVNEKAAEKARAAGLNVVMDLCLKIEHARLM